MASYSHYDTLVVSIVTKNGCLNFQQQRTISALALRTTLILFFF